MPFSMHIMSDKFNLTFDLLFKKISLVLHLTFDLPFKKVSLVLHLSSDL